MTKINSTIEKPGEGLGDYTALRLMVQQMLSRVNTVALVRVVKSYPGGTGPIGEVDVEPMVNLLDGAGDGKALSTLHNLPCLRIQGGANAMILDPKPGDIGIAVFCSRDISTVKRTKKPGNPGSWATHSMSDGLYLGGVLNGAPSQYVQFHDGGGITIHSTGAVNIVSTSLTHNGVNIGATHVHGGVETGGGSTSIPH